MTSWLDSTRHPDSKWVSRRIVYSQKLSWRWRGPLLHPFPPQSMDFCLRLLTCVSHVGTATSWRRTTSTSTQTRWTTTWSVTSACRRSSGLWTRPADTPTARSASPASCWRATSARCAARPSCCRAAGNPVCWCTSCWTSWLWLAPSLTFALTPWPVGKWQTTSKAGRRKEARFHFPQHGKSSLYLGAFAGLLLYFIISNIVSSNIYNDLQ